MKMMFNGVPVKKYMVHNDTQDATIVPSAMQAGLTAYANGKRVMGTGKSFEFARYGQIVTNESDYVPSDINIIHVCSLDYPVRLTIALNNMKNQNFSTPLEIGSIFVNNVFYPIFVSVSDNFITITCEQTTTLQVFYGKDNYI